MSSAEISIIIADDHNVVRYGLCHILENVAGFTVVGDTGSGHQAVKMYAELKPDIVILDITMPDQSGLVSAEEILGLDSDAKIIFLSTHISEEYVSQALQIGVLGYILKTSRADQLVHAVRCVARSEKCYDSSISEILLGDNREKVEKIILTKREEEVLRMILDGHTSAEIAEKLYISPRTVGSHRNNLIQKFNANNTATLVKSACETRYEVQH